MIPIRNKLILYFVVVVILLSGLSVFVYKSGEYTADNYEDAFQRFLVLNDISQRTNKVYEALNAYLIEEDRAYLIRYQAEREALIEDQRQLTPDMEHKENFITLKNYRNMLDSFLQETEMTLQAFHEGEINRYSFHLHEVQKTARFIQETTLSLVNSELTRYQEAYDVIRERNQYFQGMVLSVFSAILMFSTLAALWLSRGITRPIRRLSMAAREISGGYLMGKEVEVTTNDELRYLTEAFNQMRRNIRRLIREMKEKSELDRLLKEMELKSLQSQINPHFLFNTLNTIGRMAYMEGADQTNRLIDAVSALFRYNLRNLDKPSTLAEEVAIVREYFFIQQTRFGERMQFVTDIDERCLEITIPPLTLQPLVENAFVHGIESVEDGARIEIKITRRGGYVVVEVIDNGAGMDEKTRQQLLQTDEKASDFTRLKPEKGHSTGLGIRNVIKRLELFYSEKELLDIESEPGKGTVVRIFLPADRKERGKSGERAGGR